jgi:hypothetical protein
MTASVKGCPTPAPENEMAGSHVAGTGRCWITAKGGNRERGAWRSEVYGDLSGYAEVVYGGKEPQGRRSIERNVGMQRWKADAGCWV